MQASAAMHQALMRSSVALILAHWSSCCCAVLTQSPNGPIRRLAARKAPHAIPPRPAGAPPEPTPRGAAAGAGGQARHGGRGGAGRAGQCRGGHLHRRHDGQALGPGRGQPDHRGRHLWVGRRLRRLGTGTGEYFIRPDRGARQSAALVEYKGLTPAGGRRRGDPDRLTALGGDGGVIAVTPDGQMAWSFNTSGHVPRPPGGRATADRASIYKTTEPCRVRPNGATGSRSAARRARHSRQAHADLPEGTYRARDLQGGLLRPRRLHPPPSPADRLDELRGAAAAARLRPDGLNEPQASPWARADGAVQRARRDALLEAGAPMPALARNADGDQLLFVHDGAGELFCDFGHLAFGPATTSTCRAARCGGWSPRRPPRCC